MTFVPGMTLLKSCHDVVSVDSGELSCECSPLNLVRLYAWYPQKK